MSDGMEDKIRNLEEWNKERERLKPVVDAAVDYHNQARFEARRRNYGKALILYKEAIKHYKKALGLNPKYYLKDLINRIDHVIEEHVNNTFNLKISSDNLKTAKGINEFVEFIDNLKGEEKKYIDQYNIAQAFLRIGDLYYEEEGRRKEAYDFYSRVIDVNCDRPFVNRDAYFKMGLILLSEDRFKEALVTFVSVLSFDRDNSDIIGYIDHCLRKLGIVEHKAKFLVATPMEARKLIMEVL